MTTENTENTEESGFSLFRVFGVFRGFFLSFSLQRSRSPCLVDDSASLPTNPMPVSFREDDIGSVTYVFGTSLDGNSVPDGGLTIAMLGFALVGLDVLLRRLRVA